MAQIVADRVRETSTTTGTGTLTLGGAVTGYRSFSSVCANGDTVYYCATDNSSLWEVGLGTYNTSNLLVRTAGNVYSGSSGAGVLVNFGAGAKDVFLTFSASAIALGPTITPGGTTGAQTINKMAGTVNFAAAATTLVVTNSLVTASSIIFCTIRTADATALIKNVVPTAGSFTITLNAAATAETSVGFLVTN